MKQTSLRDRIGRWQRFGALGLAFCAVVTAASEARAQGRPPDTYLKQQRALEEEVRAELDRELPAEQKVDFQWGGSYNSWAFLWDDGIDSSRTLWRNDFRLWGGLSFDQGAHQLYARTRMSFLDFPAGDSYDGNDHDIEGPNLERGFYQFDLRRALRAYRKENIKNNFKLKIGRDVVQFGTGLALSLPMDHLLLTAEIEDFEITGLMGTSIRSTDDIERSRPNSNSMERNFWGVQAKYLGFEKHEPFAYVFWNVDQHDEDPEVWLQEYDYDSFYVGLGSRGELIRNLRYGTEWVFETGESFGDRKFLKRDDVHAWAFDFLLEYLTDWRMRPRFVGEYMFASGDPDRFLSPTNAVGGNTFGDDNSFVGFGYRDTGLSFAPRLSNIHIWRAGASFLPFEDIDFLSKMELGTDWYLYHKNRRNGAVSDATADVRSGYLGWEMDYYTNWRLTSDLSFTARYGVFFPGASFSDRTTRTFFLTGLTWSF